MKRARKRPPGEGEGDAAARDADAREFTLDDYLDHLIAESNLRDALDGRLRARAPHGPADDPGERE